MRPISLLLVCLHSSESTTVTFVSLYLCAYHSISCPATNHGLAILLATTFSLSLWRTTLYSYHCPIISLYLCSPQLPAVKRQPWTLLCKYNCHFISLCLCSPQHPAVRRQPWTLLCKYNCPFIYLCLCSPQHPAIQQQRRHLLVAF